MPTPADGRECTALDVAKSHGKRRVRCLVNTAVTDYWHYLSSTMLFPAKRAYRCFGKPALWGNENSLSSHCLRLRVCTGQQP
jgi:hypothetical protein